MNPPSLSDLAHRLRPRRDLPDLPTADEIRGLRWWNVSAFVLHLASAVAVFAVANDASLPVNAAWPCDAPGRTSVCETEHLFDIRIALLAGGFALLSALAHLLVATVARGKYERDLADGINQARWLEYSISSTVMIVAISMITGIVELGALIGIGAANIAMILFGWAFEREARAARAHGGGLSWFSFWAGCIVALAPWIAIFAYATGSDTIPNFVWGILVSLLLFFNCFAIVQILEYRRIGPWKRVVVAERTYIVLSFTAKVALTWQIAANTLF